MKQIVAVDPGLTACGVALFNEHGYLTHAELAVNEVGTNADLPARWEGAALAVAETIARCSSDAFPLVAAGRLLVVEMPKVYPAARQKGDQNDLMNLAGAVASLFALVHHANRRLLYPRDWKGTLDPDEMIERIAGKSNPDGQRVGGRLFPLEHLAVRLPSAKSLQHNVWDAVGIGLHVVGRLEDRKVIAR